MKTSCSSAPSHSQQLLVCILILALVFAAVPQPLAAATTDAPSASLLRLKGQETDSNEAHFRPVNAATSVAAGAPRPTLAFDPQHGAAGETLTVSGQATGGFRSVRLAWWSEASTRTAGLAEVDARDHYSAKLTVPDDLAPGKVQICAAYTGTDLAEFACGNFIVDAPQPGKIWGHIPVPFPGQSFAARVEVIDRGNDVVASGLVAADGSFEISSIAPGSYRLVVADSPQRPVGAVNLSVNPGRTLVVAADSWPVVSSATCDDYAPFVTRISATPSADPPPDWDDFGYFLSLGSSGAPVNVTFASSVSSRYGLQVQSVDFVFRSRGGNDIGPITALNGPPWQITYNVSQLPAGRYTLLVTAHAGACQSEGRSHFSVLTNPMADPSHLYQEMMIGWDNDRSRYNFSGWLPDVGGLLPFIYPDPPPELPLLGTLENRIDAGLYFEGSMMLDGRVSLRIFEASANVRLFSKDIWNSSLGLVDPLVEQVSEGGEPNWQSIPFGPATLYEFSKSTTVYSGPLWSYAGLVTLRLSIAVGIRGGLYLMGDFYPMAPRIDATLEPAVEPWLSITLSLDILFGVVSIGSTLRASAGLGLPLRFDNRHDPQVWVDQPCVGARLTLTVWLEILWVISWDLYQWTPVDWRSPPGCRLPWWTASSAEVAASGSPPADMPRVMAAPAVAAGPHGERLAVYVEDATPAATAPTPRIITRFWDSQAQSWDPPIALTAGSHPVYDPAAAFVGPDGRALVVWTENTIRLTGDDRGRGELNDVLGRQEIYYSIWSGQAWSSPTALTDDFRPDGQAALAGDAEGATLAWTRDTDGDIATRNDWAIIAMQYDDATNTWSDPELLEGAPLPPAATDTREAEADLSSISLPAGEPQATISVNSAKDLPDLEPGDGKCEANVLHECTLRAAIQEANKLGGNNRILLPAGTYVLRIAGQNEDGALTGDLDLIGDLSLEGSGADKVTVEAAGLDRVFDIQPNARVQITGVAVKGGSNGGIRNRGDLALAHCTLVENTNAWDGGGVASTGNLIMRLSQIGGNTARNGAGIASAGSLTLDRSAVYSNTSVLNGGGLWSTGQTNLTNTTISENRADDGAGIHLGGGTATLNNATIANNRGESSGGIRIADGQLTMMNSILAGNLAGSATASDCAGSLNSEGTNLIQSQDGCTMTGNQTGDILDKSPVLGALGLYGQETPVHPLLATSPAIDAGNPASPGSGGAACLAVDQQNTARPQGSRCDIGAYEWPAKRSSLNFQVSAARRRTATTSARALAWTVDLDGDWTTNGDRRIAVARWAARGWQIERPAPLPVGADSPSVALGAGQETRLAFLQRGKDADGVSDTGIGDQAVVWGARYTAWGPGYHWVAAPVVDEMGDAVRGESPLVTTENGHTLIVFRAFGAAGTTAALGQLAESADYGVPVYLTNDLSEHWQPALALDSLNGDAVILSVARDATAQAHAAEAAGRPLVVAPVQASALALTELSAADDPVGSLILKNGADPALDSMLMSSQHHPQPGASVQVTATVRNLGRLPLTGMVVRFYAGTPVTGTLVSSVKVGGELAPGVSQLATATLTANANTHLVSALLLAAQDVGPENNDATVDLSALPSPRYLTVSTLQGDANALRLYWLAPPVPGVAGYRILRAATPGGPYEFVGQTTGTTFDDVLLTPGLRYYYVVQAYDAASLKGGEIVQSPPSTEGSRQLPLLRLYLPAVRR